MLVDSVGTNRAGFDSSRRKMKLSEAIAAQILDDIARRGMTEGQPLMSEAAMLETYGGGRASVREALRILETNGLVNIKAGPRGGAVVGRVDPVQFGRSATRYFQLGGATVRELIEARLILEPATTGLAAKRRTARPATTPPTCRSPSSSTPSSLGCRATWSSTSSPWP
jgi:DNA-binding FadR family transcriptional regulator